MAVRKMIAEKLLWETLKRWKKTSPELDRIKFLKPFPSSMNSRTGNSTKLAPLYLIAIMRRVNSFLNKANPEPHCF